jgi:hypothetical protein
MNDSMTAWKWSNPLTVGLALTAIAAVSIYRDPTRFLALPGVKNLVFLISVVQIRLRHDMTHRPYFTDFGLLTIGGIPYRDNNWLSPVGNTLLEKLLSAEQSLGLVVSMVRRHEQAGVGLSLLRAGSPIQPDFWREKGVAFHSCPMQDLTAKVANTDVLAAVRAMYETVQAQKSVYVHCQAGEGRSFLMMMSYFLIYGEPQRVRAADGQISVRHHRFANYDEALAYVRARRPHVTAGRARREKILSIVEQQRGLTDRPEPSRAALKISR